MLEIRSDKRRKSTKSLRSYLSSHYNLHDDNDYATVFNTSVNRTNVKRKFEETQIRDLNTLFCDDDMDLTKLDKENSSKFTFNNSSLQLSNMDLTFISNNKESSHTYPAVPKGFIYSSNSNMDLTNLSKDQSTCSIIDKENAIVSKLNNQTALNDQENLVMISSNLNKSNKENEDDAENMSLTLLNQTSLSNNKTQMYTAASMDLTNLDRSSKFETATKDTLVYSSPEDMELTDLELNQENEMKINPFKNRMSLTNLSTLLSNYNNDTNATSVFSSQDQETSKNDLNEIKQLSTKNDKSHVFSSASMDLTNLDRSSKIETATKDTLVYSSPEDMELTDLELNQENEMKINPFKNQMSLTNLSTLSSNYNNDTNATSVFSSQDQETSKNDLNEIKQLPTKNDKSHVFSSASMDLTNLDRTRCCDATTTTPTPIKNASIHTSSDDMELTDLELNQENEMKINPFKNRMSLTNLSTLSSNYNNDTNATSVFSSQDQETSKNDLNEIKQLPTKNDKSHVFSSASMDLTNLDRTKRCDATTTEPIKNASIHTSSDDMELTDLKLNQSKENDAKTNLINLSTLSSNYNNDTNATSVFSLQDQETSKNDLNEIKQLPTKNDKSQVFSSASMDLTNLDRTKRCDATTTEPIKNASIHTSSDDMEPTDMELTDVDLNRENEMKTNPINSKMSMSASKSFNFIKKNTTNVSSSLLKAKQDKANLSRLNETSIVQFPIKNPKLNDLSTLSKLTNNQTVIGEMDVSNSLINSNSKVFSSIKCASRLNTTSVKSSFSAASRRFNTNNAWALKKDKIHSTFNFKNQSLLKDNELLEFDQPKNTFVNKTLPINLPINVPTPVFYDEHSDNIVEIKKDQTICKDEENGEIKNQEANNSIAVSNQLQVEKTKKDKTELDELISKSVDKSLHANESLKVKNSTLINNEKFINKSNDSIESLVRAKNTSMFGLDVSKNRLSIKESETRSESQINNLEEDEIMDEDDDAKLEESEQEEASELVAVDNRLEEDEKIDHENIVLEPTVDKSLHANESTFTNNKTFNKSLNDQSIVSPAKAISMFNLEASRSSSIQNQTRSAAKKTIRSALLFNNDEHTDNIVEIEKDQTICKDEENGEIKNQEANNSIAVSNQSKVEKMKKDETELDELINKSVDKSLHANESLKVENSTFTNNQSLNNQSNNSIELLMRAKNTSMFGLDVSKNRLSIKESETRSESQINNLEEDEIMDEEDDAKLEESEHEEASELVAVDNRLGEDEKMDHESIVLEPTVDKSLHANESKFTINKTFNKSLNDQSIVSPAKVTSMFDLEASRSSSIQNQTRLVAKETIRRASLFNNLLNLERELNSDTMNDSVLAFQTQTEFERISSTTTNTNLDKELNSDLHLYTATMNDSVLAFRTQTEFEKTPLSCTSSNENNDNNTNYQKNELVQQIEKAKNLMSEKSFLTDFIKDAIMYEDDKLKNYFSQHNRDVINLSAFNGHIALVLELENEYENEFSDIKDMRLVFDFEKEKLKFWSDKFYLFYADKEEHRNFIEILKIILTKQFDKLKLQLLNQFSTTEFLINIEQQVELMLNRVADFVKGIKITMLKFANFEFKLKQDDTFE